MRERRDLGIRSEQAREIKKKFFLVFEGEKTEPLYFREVVAKRERLQINPLIEIVEIRRIYEENGWSNPKKIMERLLENLKANQSGIFTYEMVHSWIVEAFLDSVPSEVRKNLIATLPVTLDDALTQILQVDSKDTVTDLESTVKTLVESAAQSVTIPKNITELTKLAISIGTISYEEDFDTVALIFDRDPCSFTEGQFDDVERLCQANNFSLHITNPCFEFWLLLHFDEVTSLDHDQLLANQKVDGDRRYAEVELSKLLPSYQKNDFDAKILMDKIDKAIENEAKFCQSIPELKTKLGSNVGSLFTKLREA